MCGRQRVPYEKERENEKKTLGKKILLFRKKKIRIQIGRAHV